MPLNAVVELPDSDREELAWWLQALSMPAGLALRAQIVLLAADGAGTSEIVPWTGCRSPAPRHRKQVFLLVDLGNSIPRESREIWT